MSKNISDNLKITVLQFSNIKCHVCHRKLTINNINFFFNYPNNQNKFFYCSNECFNHI